MMKIMKLMKFMKMKIIFNNYIKVCKVCSSTHQLSFSNTISQTITFSKAFINCFISSYEKR